ncbi:MAG: hypothetical protein A2535_14855 [Burkholderiales bacterium RIFOXYD2_FULL_59_8]|nr:MAG: hypothetical protein A2535_14855 [Burkholderiales bacterium RIFOXYD2_FULL_59_8]
MGEWVKIKSLTRKQHCDAELIIFIGEKRNSRLRKNPQPVEAVSVLCEAHFPVHSWLNALEFSIYFWPP